MISKDYFLTNHVRFRMKERDISEKEIAEVLKSPQVSYPGKKGEINVIKEIERGKRKEERGKRIRVIYTIERKRKIIITAIRV